MATTSSAPRLSAQKRAKRQTQTTKSHRYEPFTKRVAKLKIDPIHKVQRTRVKESHNDLSQSYFRAALDEWSELNLTVTFTSFFNKVNSLCENLPQLLHHADTIVDLLLQHIEKQDPLALEALLSLVAHLAHDLGQDFEKYFIRTVKVVARVSTIQDDPAVIESCFTCLAWMYKYLSRLLIQDLRPLLNVLLPYFSARKDYIRRFTSEALAFLIRKAAVQYVKNETCLKIAMKEILEHETEQTKNRDDDGYVESCIILLSESAKGTDGGLHSSAPDLFQCLFGLVTTTDLNMSKGERVIEGVLVSLIHDTNAAGFRPLLGAVLSCVERDLQSPIPHDLSTRLLLVMAATRSGSRISDWTEVISLVSQVLSTNGRASDTSNSIKVTAAIVQYCPLDQLLPSLPKLISAITQSRPPRQFFSFCETVARLGKSRFRDLLLPHLQKYIVSHWAEDTDGLTVALNDLHNLQCIDSRVGKASCIGVGDKWESAIEEILSADLLQDKAFQEQYRSLILARCTQFPRNGQTKVTLSEALTRHLVDALSPAKIELDLQTRVSLGWGFQTLLLLRPSELILSEQQAKTILDLPEDRLQILPFVEALNRFIPRRERSEMKINELDSLSRRIAKNMLSTSLDLRKASIMLVQALYPPGLLAWLDETCQVLMGILDTSYSISNVRQLGMLIRRLPHLQKATPESHSLIELIPLFTIGLIPSFHDQLRKELSSILGSIMTNLKTEEVVVDIMKDWLQAPPSPASNDTTSIHDARSRASHYECTKLNELDDQYSKADARFENPQSILQSNIEDAHLILPTRLPVESRSLALQVLNDMPQIAEKRSKVLVPAFLAAQRSRTGYDPSFLDESQSVNTLSPDIEEGGWTTRERKLFLHLIGQFNNPRMLYRVDDIRAVLYDLLSNGDAETRKLALLALLKWKDRALQEHRDILLEVAEATKTTTELGTLLIGDESEGIKDEQRAEVLPVLLRLLFGQLIGRAGTSGSQEAKRKSILRLIFRMTPQDIFLFLDIVRGRLRDITIADIQTSKAPQMMTGTGTKDQQYGFVRMCLSMLEILQTQFAPFGSKIIDAVLYCTVTASRQIHAIGETEAAPALPRNIRRTGIQCLNLIFEYCPELDLRAYLPVIFSELVEPRLAKFAAENSQGVSGLLKMFSVWAKSTTNIMFVEYEDCKILKACWSLLGSENCKADVKVFILTELVDALLQHEANQQAALILQDQLPSILENVSRLLEQNVPKDLLMTTTKTLQGLAGDVGSSQVKERIVELLIQVLREPSQRLPPHIKAQVLRAIEELAGTLDGQMLSLLQGDFYQMLASYFDFFRDAPNRQTCCRILTNMANEKTSLQDVAKICENLNASSTASLDEMDYDKQAEAFGKIHLLIENERLTEDFLPVLHNLIFVTRTNEETAARGNALSCLKHFIADVSDGFEGDRVLQKVLLQAVRRQLTNDSETVRADFVEMLGAIVKHWESEIPLQDMDALLVGDDEEASFFTNILHIQSHRRNRAMRRLTSQVETGAISAENIAEYFLPLLQKFANDDSTSESSQSTRGQSVASITILLKWLDWKSFRKILRQYKQGLEYKKEDDKLDVRLLDHAADALNAVVTAKESETDVDSPLPHLARSLPAQDVLSQELRTNFIPRLTELSHYKDEGEISQRLPAAVVAVKLIKLLPQPEVALLASPIVLDVAQVLRSRTQETRDLARNKLAEIINLLGSSSVQFALKELRTALTRGYQLHVLSYTLHTILLATTDSRHVGDLDYCVDDIVKVVFDDVFGVVGQEKENQDYVSSMKEVKRNKSFDTIEMMAECTDIKQMARLILPFESLLTGSLTTKQVRSVDEIFRRIGVGISHNSTANTQDMLVFAFQLIQSFYQSKVVRPVKPQTNDEKNRERFLVQKDNVSKVGKITSSSLLYKVAKFAIDIVRSTFAKHSEIMTPENVHGFIPIIGDALIEGQEDVKVSALRLLSTVIKLQLPEFDENAKMYVMEAVKVVRGTSSTNEEAAQAALKLVAAILREKRSVEVRESDVAYILKRTMPDLEEPDRQGVTFNFVKAIMARKMQMPEVYELVDQIGLMMITSQSKSSRDAARGVYVHFLLDYPQGKTRWSKQIKFLIKNLEYEHPEGRQSVMEAMNNLYSKLDKATAQEMAAVIFVPLVLRLSNDENLHCREIAGALLSNIFRGTPLDQTDSILQPLREWLEQNDNFVLRKISLQTWSLYFNARDLEEGSDVIFVKKQILSILREINDDDDDGWGIVYQALELMAILVPKYPELMLDSKQEALWKNVISIMASSQVWLQQSAATLVGLLFRDCIAAGNMEVPLISSQGLVIKETDLIDLLRSMTRMLKYQTTSEDLANIVMQNLVFLGQSLAASDTRVPLKLHSDDPDEDSDEQDDADEDEGMEHKITNGTSHSITAIQYLIDQTSSVLRREPLKQTSQALNTKISFTTFLANLIPHTSKETLEQNMLSVTKLLMPLLHLTSQSTNAPRSSDPLFASTYTTLTEQCQLLLDALQAKLGDQQYMKCVTSATRLSREKRAERRNKRAFDVVAEPERAAREKRRRFEKKKERRKEVKGIHRGVRRKDLGF